MDTSQVWRFPKKYAELFKNLSNEDVWIIIKSLFLNNTLDLEWLNKAYYDIIKVDLDNLEKSALNWSKWGRPKKKENSITPGYENTKPQVMKNDNLKEREEEREEEKEIKEELKIFSELWKENKSMMSSYLMYVFLDLWFIPNKKETVESFKLWFKEKILDNYKIDNTTQIKSIIDNFHTYWLEQEKKPKNFKTTFMNTPLLNNLK